MALALIQRLRGAWWGLRMQAADPISDLRHPTAWLKSWFVGSMSHAGVMVSPQAAMTLSAYFGAARAISEDVAKLPLKVYERLDRGKRPASEHWAYPILHDAPNQYQSSMNFREAMTFHALTWGNAYAPILSDGRGFKFGLPIHPGRVEPRYDDEQNLYYRVHTGDTYTRSEGIQNRQTIDIPQENMLHIRGPSGDGITGWSIAQLGAESLGLSLATQQFGASFFGNGANVGSVLEHPGSLSETAIQHLTESFKLRQGSLENANKPLILEEGMKFQRLGIPPEDAQFLQTREFQVVEISRWFRIPPHKIAHLANATFSNIEHQALEYTTDTLEPWLQRWEQEIQRKLFAPNDPNFFAEHLVTGLLRGDQAARSAYYNTLFQMGSLSPNEIRELENLNPIPGDLGDTYYMQSNMAPLDRIGSNIGPADQGGSFDNSGNGREPNPPI